MFLIHEDQQLKKIRLISALSAVLFLTANQTYAAMNHGGGGGNKGGPSACKSYSISHFKPAHLANVAPQSAFSFWVKGVKDPDDVTVTVKKIPVLLQNKEMSNFYLFSGTLPESLKGTAARLQVKMKTKKCTMEKGVLLKITD